MNDAEQIVELDPELADPLGVTDAADPRPVPHGLDLTGDPGYLMTRREPTLSTPDRKRVLPDEDRTSTLHYVH
ncbi:hypothetical protein Ais01nite_79700 [Asanoa ishikariensis]|nr:hypothetical protein Ais01nite_79700 [Asanoa ishikariensis]